jgi:endonuclease G
MDNFEKSPALRTIEKEILDDIRDMVATKESILPEASGTERARFEGFLEPRRGSGSFDALGAPRGEAAAPAVGGQKRANFEAIILSIARPSLLVRNGTYVEPQSESRKVLEIIRGFKRPAIDEVIARTGRVEFSNVPNLAYVGTGWVVEKPSERTAIIVTNRHVAKEFAAADGRGGYRFNTLPNFRDYEVKVDFLKEYNEQASREAAVLRVVFMAGDNDPDIALLEAENDFLKDLSPMEFSPSKLTLDTRLGVVGYPAYDSRSDPDDVAKYFGDIFDVKRFAFGNVTGIGDHPEFTHDATTLGGNSGSCVFDRETGKAVGLHFAGNYKIANYAVPTSEVAATLKGLKTQVVVPSMAGIEAAGDGKSPARSFKGRDGYNREFLGSRITIDPPKPGEAWKNDLADVFDAESGGAAKELKYRHFSVWMSQSRKLPLITAVNIDGGKAKRMGRIDRWYIDERLSTDYQVDNAAYAKNPLDRGHMVRREDPVWGRRNDAAQANRDTFHYTNCAPQHEGLNQRDWVNLEDYVLGNAKTYRLKVSVFAGPIFGENDQLYRGLVRLPQAFWKIAALINSETDKLSVTGYILCQGSLIKDLTSEFVYGAFRTYQVPLSLIADQAQLDLNHLLSYDPLTARREREGIDNTSRSLFVAINGASDLVI